MSAKPHREAEITRKVVFPTVESALVHYVLNRLREAGFNFTIVPGIPARKFFKNISPRSQ